MTDDGTYARTRAGAADDDILYIYIAVVVKGGYGDGHGGLG